MIMNNNGKEFEDLVYTINKVLHQKCIVTPNDKIPDKDTGKTRQIDISIRVCDGPTHFLGIIEVRDRNRPVTVEYVEQVSEKARSVRANAAYIVSSAGFADTALRKAKSLGIGTLLYSEALQSDWKSVLPLSTALITRQYDKVTIFNMNATFAHIINPHPSVREAIQTDIDSLVFVDENRKPILSIAQLAFQLIQNCSDRLFAGIMPNQPPVQRAQRFNLTTEPGLYLKGADEEYHSVKHILLVADFFIRETTQSNRLYIYKDPEKNEPYAEVASSDFVHMGVRYRQDMIASHASSTGDIPVFIRIRET